MALGRLLGQSMFFLEKGCRFIACHECLPEKKHPKSIFSDHLYITGCSPHPPQKKVLHNLRDLHKVFPSYHIRLITSLQMFQIFRNDFLDHQWLCIDPNLTDFEARQGDPGATRFFLSPLGFWVSEHRTGWDCRLGIFFVSFKGKVHHFPHFPPIFFEEWATEMVLFCFFLFFFWGGKFSSG